MLKKCSRKRNWLTISNFRKTIKSISVFTSFHKLLDENIINPCHVWKWRNYHVLEAAFLHFVVNFPFTLQGVTPKLTCKNTKFSYQTVSILTLVWPWNWGTMASRWFWFVKQASMEYKVIPNAIKIYNSAMTMPMWIYKSKSSSKTKYVFCDM